MKRGFTLIEMVVSISIVTIIAVLFIANYHSSNKRTDLIMAAQNLVADLHAAQNNALGLVKYGATPALAEVPAGGWGISFDTSLNSYTLFADLDIPSTPSSPSPGYREYDPETEGNINYGARVTQLPPQIEIMELKTTDADEDTHLDDQVNVTFLPPDPSTNIYRVNAVATSTVLEIKFREKQNNTTKTVRINFLGLAEVSD
jgi:prepilin-type N-terminal cleavage/methylation domain-containing protein